ncbi:hypothetical protein [Phenylobacterium sp.]|uniref:hypothetical protein n=1 Tax=Phenylobacterium sp. TaxID=1871053 RepID=UPI002E34DAEF|nr:hypothetical protein [Phenylobacterium sp.]HEX3367626.1 hypothetical protein [Phenylobacterium sp.]
MRRTIATIGYVLIGLIVLGIVGDMLAATLKHQAFYGVNYLGLPLGTYSMALVLVMAGTIGAVRLVQIYRAKKRRERC